MVENEVLDANILMEKKSGLTTVFNVIEYPPASEKCIILWPRKTDFRLALDIAIRLRRIGKTIPAVDILTASMCINRKLRLVTKDGHYKSIKFVEPEFKLKIVK